MSVCSLKLEKSNSSFEMISKKTKKIRKLRSGPIPSAKPQLFKTRLNFKKF